MSGPVSRPSTGRASLPSFVALMITAVRVLSMLFMALFVFGAIAGVTEVVSFVRGRKARELEASLPRAQQMANAPLSHHASPRGALTALLCAALALGCFWVYEHPADPRLYAPLASFGIEAPTPEASDGPAADPDVIPPHARGVKP
jgi:hypothetical protein